MRRIARIGGMTYRPDIDGLRAVAVLAVIGFHAFPGWVPGGFVGVDVFFVISGYLISGLIIDETSQGRFSIITFYARRARRIFPALIAVLAAVLLFGWALFLPDELSELGRQIFAGALFSSNVLLWMQTGYFDTAASLKPLLHLWSLGIEEQFYILWPLVLLALPANGRMRLWLIGALLLASFVANLFLVHAYPSATFYLPATRAWELLIGAFSRHARAGAALDFCSRFRLELCGLCGSGADSGEHNGLHCGNIFSGVGSAGADRWNTVAHRCRPGPAANIPQRARPFASHSGLHRPYQLPAISLALAAVVHCADLTLRRAAARSRAPHARADRVRIGRADIFGH
jgi:hypothetical protein